MMTVHGFSVVRRMIRFSIAAVIMLLAAPTVAFSHDAVTTGMVNMRAGPDQSFPIVTVLSMGSRLTVLGCISDYRWCDVSTGGARGWVHAGYISYPYQGRQVVIVDYGPSLALPIATFALGVYWADHYRHYPWYPQYRHWHNWHYRAHPPPHAGPRPPQHPAGPGPRPPPPPAGAGPRPPQPRPPGAGPRPPQPPPGAGPRPPQPPSGGKPPPPKKPPLGGGQPPGPTPR